MTTTLRPTVLDRCRAEVLPALQVAVARLDPLSRAATGYHLGWTEADGTPREGDAGKSVRSALSLLSAELAGAPARVAVPAAVAVELVHNFSLLHDDVMDGDRTRRHRPTVWCLWGTSNALLVGDAVLALAGEVLLESSAPGARAATHELLSATRRLVRGQVADLAFERRPAVDLQECLDMAEDKTGALLATSAAIGAVLAGAPATVVAALRTYGRQLGLAFQLVDDLLGIWGDPVVTGKPVLADLRTRKKTLPVTYVLCRDDGAARELARWYAADPPPQGDSVDQLQHAADLVEAGGGRAWAAEEAAHRLGRAERALTGLPLPRGPRSELIALGRFLVQRES